MSSNKQFAVLGLGRFGQSIAKTLYNNRAEVLVCDKNEELVQDSSKYATYSVQADISDNDALEELGIGNFDVVIIAVGADLEASLIATIHAKEKGCDYVLVKANNFMQKFILEKLGADRVVLPEREMGEKVALNLLSGNFIDMINLSDRYSIIETLPLDKWLNKTLRDANIRAEYGLNILAIKRNNSIIVSLKPDEIIKENDILVVIGDNACVKKLTQK